MRSIDAPSLERLLRYREVVSDWDAFVEASHAPEPVTLRVRAGLADPDELRANLEARGFRLEPVPGLDRTLSLKGGPGSVAQTLEHWLGLFHVQQAVMALPSLALGAGAGERILDLCAAPGGKTVHLAELMEDRGCLVAVDPKEKRLRGLLSNVFRLGHPNVLVIAADGRSLPGGAAFDRVLVDAPCSAEGNYRRQKGRLPPRTRAFERYVTGLQEALLRRGIELTRPGGTIVYSTCTFAPEENEAVVSRVLREAPVRIEPIALGLPHEPGLEAWDGTSFPADLRHAWRVYPHHLDSGGMFMVRLRRLADDGSEAEPAARAPRGWEEVPAAFPGEDESAARARIAHGIHVLERTFGFRSDSAEPIGWMVRGDNIWAHTAGEWPLDAWAATGGWRVVSLGLRALRGGAQGVETPSNPFVTRFGDRFGPSGRTLELAPGDLRALLESPPLPVGDVSRGHVILRFRGRALGRGMVREEGLRSEIPKAQAVRLLAVLREADEGPGVGAEPTGPPPGISGR